jgi:hypothetical protein
VEKLNVLINDLAGGSCCAAILAASFTLVTFEISSFLISFQRSPLEGGGDGSTMNVKMDPGISSREEWLLALH